MWIFCTAAIGGGFILLCCVAEGVFNAAQAIHDWKCERRCNRVQRNVHC